VGWGAEEHDGDLEPGRVLGTVEGSERGVPQPLTDADPSMEGPAHQAGLGARTRARVVLGPALNTGGRAQLLFSRWSRQEPPIAGLEPPPWPGLDPPAPSWRTPVGNADAGIRKIIRDNTGDGQGVVISE